MIFSVADGVGDVAGVPAEGLDQPTGSNVRGTLDKSAVRVEPRMSQADLAPEPLRSPRSRFFAAR
jgi:hypothetical protein